QIDEIRCRAAGKRLSFFLDYGGTLTPIAERPELALLAAETRETLSRLASHATVAVVSGRDLRDVQAMVNLDGIYYAGSHGFEIVAPSGDRLDADPGAAFVPALDQASAELEQALAGITGSQVERKRFSIAIHYRRVAATDLDAVKQAVAAIASRYDNLKCAGGKKIHELQPRVEWHKGKAVLLLLDRLDEGGETVLPIYIGDDVTDENAFAALRDRGFGVIVTQESRPTAARYRLRDPAEVRQYLEKLSGPAPIEAKPV
ncbi:MAG: trehalose-phosphatase, partial [bacterium]|nr:trehalose-phosphatase [bacterium]